MGNGNRSPVTALIAGVLLLAMGTAGWAAGSPESPAAAPAEHRGWDELPLDRNLVVPQVAVGSNIVTTLVLANPAHPLQAPWMTPEQRRLEGVVSLFDNAGEPLEVKVNGEVTARFKFALEGGQLAVFDLAGLQNLQTGWMLIDVRSAVTDAAGDAGNSDAGDDSDESSEEDAGHHGTGNNDAGASGDADWGYLDDDHFAGGKRLLANVYYTIRDGSAVRSRVGVVPAVFEPGRFRRAWLPVQVTGELDTGLALVNVANTDAKVTLRLILRNGSWIVEHSFILPAGHQVAHFVGEWFDQLLSPQPEKIEGLLEIVTDGTDVVPLGLIQAGWVLTALPVHHFGEWRALPAP
ncbi:MAG: hypothetical protein Kow00109_14600 [Acidobacteriota bacterium]